MKIFIILFYIIVPALILRLCYVSKIANKFGPILICYVVGMIFGQLFIGEETRNIPDIVTTIMIPLALPMLLFETNVKSWKKMAKSAFLSMIIAVISMIIMIIAGYFIFRNSIPEANKVAGMLSGIYTGGTPNLAALKAALNVSEDVYIAVNTVDIFIGAFYVLFLISFAKKLFSKVLPPYPYPIAEQVSTEEKRVIKRLKVWVKHVSLPNILAAFGVSILIAAIGAGTGFSITKNPAYQMAITILIITTLAIVASNITLVKKIRGSFDIGMYLILIFSIAVASMADFSNITRSVLPLIGYISIATFGTMIMHLIGCRIFKIDADTMMVTSAALICSPPFVPVVCGAIKNKDVMVSGITIGVIGYAIGNYIGVLIAWLL